MRELGIADVAEHGTWRLLHGDGEHALTEQREGGFGVENVPEEAVDGGKSGVARANGVAPSGLEVVEEREDPIGREVFDVQCGGGAMHRCGQEAQQELEGIAIRGDGMRADVSLGREMPREERRDEGRQVVDGHRGSPSERRCPKRSA